MERLIRERIIRLRVHEAGWMPGEILGRRQKGVILVISLILLATLSLLAVAMLHTSTSQLRIIANMQDEMLLESLAQAELDEFRNQTDRFGADTCNPPSHRTIPGSLLESYVADFEFDVDEPRCLQAKVEVGASELSPTAPEETLWEIRVSGRDTRTGAEVALRQGLILYLPSGQCPLAPTGRPC